METKNTFNLLFFTIKNRRDSNGEVPLYVRITISKKKTEFSLHRKVNERLWNSSAGLVNGNTKHAREINNYILSVQTSLYEHYKYLRETGKELTPKAIKNAWLGIEDEKDKGRKVIEVFEEHNKRTRELEGIDFAPGTVERYATCLRHTQDFIRRHYNKDDIYLSELDYDFITNYEMYYKTIRKCGHNTALKYIKNFKKIVNLSIVNGWLEKDPFVNFKMKIKKVDRDFLTDEELDALIQKKFKITRLEQVRDCFLVSCFTGLAHADLYRLTPDNLYIGNNGGTWIKINRKKTNNAAHIPVLPVTAKLIEKYKNHKHCITKGVLLPVLSNQKMNAYLKEVADLCGIKKNLTSHIARHTFATTVTLNNDVPIESVSKMLGHSSINMTRTYARLLDKKVERDMQHLHDKFDIAM